MKKDETLKKIIIIFGLILIILQFVLYLLNYYGITGYNKFFWSIVHSRDPARDWQPKVSLVIYSFIMLILSTLISIAKIRNKIISTLRNKIEKRKIKRKILFFIILSLIFLIAAFTFRFSNDAVNSRDHWGITIVNKASTDPSRLFYMSAPISSYSLFVFYKLASSLFSWDTVKSTEIIFLLTAPFYFLILLVLADKLTENKLRKLLLFLLFISTGFAQFLFGWYDGTTFGYFWTIVFLLLSFLYIKNKIKFIYPVLAYWLSFWTSAAMFWFFPGLLFLYFFNSKINELSIKNFFRGIFNKKFLKFILLLIIPTILLFLFIEINLYKIFNIHIYNIEKIKVGSLLGGGDGIIFVPLFKITTHWQFFTMFSSAHFLDFLNFNLLLAPFGLMLFILLILFYKRQINFKNPFLYFLLILVAFFLLFMTTFNTDEIEVAAWDIYAPIHILFVIINSFILFNIKKENLWEELALIIFIFSISLTIPWIISNSQLAHYIINYQ